MRERGGYRLREVPVAKFRVSEKNTESRINLVVLNSGAAFGGDDTFRRFFDAIRPHFSRARLILLNEKESEFVAGSWPGWTLESAYPDSAQSVVCVPEKDFTLTVEKQDVFIATYWLTAIYVQSLRRASSDGRHDEPVPYVYFIQDFEPGFYAFSSRYLLADETYRQARGSIGVFCTQLLHDYFIDNGYDFRKHYFFEPRLNPALAEARKKLPGHQKQRLMLIYGRPGKARNAFELVHEALILWANNYPDAHKWTVLSLGEKHQDYPLGDGVVLQSIGKATLQGYADYLLEASVGMALMATPHPSYPPLEMAEFGLRVVTNDFANKRMSECSPNIIAVRSPTPANLAQALTRACEACEQGAPLSEEPVFRGGAEEFPFIAEIAADLKHAGMPSENT